MIDYHNKSQVNKITRPIMPPYLITAVYLWKTIFHTIRLIPISQ